MTVSLAIDVALAAVFIFLAMRFIMRKKKQTLSY
jgi:predicted branched-subunit amino acid permease